MSDPDDLLQQQLDLMKQSADALQRAVNVSQSQYGVFAKWIADVVSGEVAARTPPRRSLWQRITRWLRHH